MVLPACASLAIVLTTLPGTVGYGQRPKTLQRVSSNVKAVDLKNEEGGVILVGSEFCLEATVTVNAELDNMVPSQPLPWTFVMTREPQRLLLAPIDPTLPWTYTFSYRWRPGGTKAKSNSKVVYRLPYPEENQWKVIQGNFGKRTHGQGSGDEYSVDWAMPEGSTVCAARPGVVIAIKQDSDAGGVGMEFFHLNNYVILRHDDNTCGSYMHLQKDGALVEIGQKVKVGDKIGLSGNTGNSAGPHLHFGVYINRDGIERQSFPIRWKTSQGILDQLVEGQSY